MAQKRIAVIGGSLRTASFHRKMAPALMKVAPASRDCDMIQIGGSPHYDFRNQMAARRSA